MNHLEQNWGSLKDREEKGSLLQGEKQKEYNLYQYLRLQYTIFISTQGFLWKPTSVTNFPNFAPIYTNFSIFIRNMKKRNPDKFQYFSSSFRKISLTVKQFP